MAGLRLHEGLIIKYRLMRGLRLKTIIFYAVLCYFLYRFFLGEEAEPLPLSEQQQSQTLFPDKSTPDSDRNIIIRAIFFVASIIPWAFSCIWAVLGFFWSVVAFLWSIINHVWTLFMLVVNGVYTTIIIYTNNRHHVKSEVFFLEMGLIFLVLPMVVNWLLIRHELAFNLLLPIYLTIFVAVNGGVTFEKTTPRNLVFFLVVCAIF